MKTLLMALFAVGLIAAVPVRAGAEGAGGIDFGNGGELVFVDGQFQLRDLADETVNVAWHTGEELAERYAPSVMRDVLEYVEREDWVFADILRFELRALSFALVDSRLKKVPTEDNPNAGVLVPPPPHGGPNYFQAAVRTRGYKVYVDNLLFRELSETNRAFLILHEALHAFIHKQDGQRYFKLRSFVKFIFDNFRSESPGAPLTSQIHGFGLVFGPSQFRPIYLPNVQELRSDWFVDRGNREAVGNTIEGNATALKIADINRGTYAHLMAQASRNSGDRERMKYYRSKKKQEGVRRCDYADYIYWELECH